MMRRTAVPAIVCAVSAAARAGTAETQTSVPPRETRGVNLILSGLFAPEHQRMNYGFLLGGGVEFPVPLGIDLNLGMSFERIGSLDGPVTLVNVIEFTAARQAATSVFFGGGFGPIFAAGNVRPGGKLFGGAELFHAGAVPLHVAIELLMKFCGNDPAVQCEAGAKQLWLAGRLGFRL